MMLAIPQETEALARRLAAKVGATPEQVVQQAVERSAIAAGLMAPRARPRRTAEERIAAILAISNRCAALPVLDERPADVILDYDDFGVPR